MFELFDIEEAQRLSAPALAARTLRRHLIDARAVGQPDLFGQVSEASAAPVTVPFAWPEPVGAFFARADLSGETVLA